MSPTCSTLSRCLQNQRHFWTRLLYLLSRFVVRHRLNCLVLVYIYLYYFTSGKTYFAFQIWRPLKWFRYPCYDVGCYPCFRFILVQKLNAFKVIVTCITVCSSVKRLSNDTHVRLSAIFYKGEYFYSGKNFGSKFSLRVDLSVSLSHKTCMFSV